MSSVFMIVEPPMKPSSVVVMDYHNPAAEVFSYDFDNGNLSDWTFLSIDGGFPYT